MYIRFESIIMGIIWAMLIILPFSILFTMNGSITIEVPYKSQYNYCLTQLESKCPEYVCPEVKCRETFGSIILWIAGALFYVSGLIFMQNKEIKPKIKQKIKDITTKRTKANE